MRTIHADACDGGIRSSIRLPELRGECAACPSHRATLLGRILATAESPCDQRTQRRRTAHAVGDAWVAWRRLHLLLRPILAARQARQRRYQELPKRPPVDDLALSRRTWLFLPLSADVTGRPPPLWCRPALEERIGSSSSLPVAVPVPPPVVAPAARPPRHRAAKPRNELARSHHWITSSAVANSVSGTVRPSALAVARLMTSSNLVDCTTGRSAGLMPLRILPV